MPRRSWKKTWPLWNVSGSVWPKRTAKTLPTGMATDWSDLSYQEATQGDAAMVVFPLQTAQLGEAHRWSQRLSPGEQQRLAFARVLLNRPDWLFLDEATSALDEDMEQRMYALLRERLPETTLVSIAHRPTVAAFHDLRLTLAPSAGGAQVQLAPLAAAAH